MISMVDVDELINLNAFGNVVRDSVLSKNSNILSILSSLLILMMRRYNNNREIEETVFRSYSSL